MLIQSLLFNLDLFDYCNAESYDILAKVARNHLVLPGDNVAIYMIVYSATEHILSFCCNTEELVRKKISYMELLDFS